MNDDFESSLRTSLRAAADRHALDLDVDDVIDAGQEALTRRTRRRAMASVGLAAAAAMVAGGVWQGSARTSQVPASTPGAADPATVVLDVNDDVPGRSAKLQVRTKDVPGATEVELVGLAEDGSHVGPAQRGTLPANRAASHLVLGQRMADHCALVLVRGAATDIQSVTASNATGGGPGVTFSGPTRIAGTEMTVQLLCEIGPNGTRTTGRYLQSLRGFVWRAGDGSMKDSEGRTVPHADLSLAGRTFRVYQDLPLDTFGVIGEPFTASNWPSQVKQRIQIAGASDDHWVVAGTLPKGARLERVSWAPSRKAVEFGQGGRTADGGTFFVADTRSGLPAEQMKDPAITYRTVDGRTVTERS